MVTFLVIISHHVRNKMFRSKSDCLTIELFKVLTHIKLEEMKNYFNRY